LGKKLVEGQLLEMYCQVSVKLSNSKSEKLLVILEFGKRRGKRKKNLKKMKYFV
jgi:hypothetical protein